MVFHLIKRPMPCKWIFTQCAHIWCAIDIVKSSGIHAYAVISISLLFFYQANRLRACGFDARKCTVMRALMIMFRSTNFLLILTRIIPRLPTYSVAVFVFFFFCMKKSSSLVFRAIHWETWFSLYLQMTWINMYI